MVGCAAVLFLGVGMLWVSRWDVMANAGAVSGGWFIGSVLSWEWTRIVPKFFHLVFSSLAIGGMVIVGLGLSGWSRWQDREGTKAPFSMSDNSQTIRYGVGWILSGLVPQILIGPWLFLVLGEGERLQLIDGTSLTSAIFFVSLTAALLALVLLNASFMVPHVTGLVWGGIISSMITLVLMGVVRVRDLPCYC